MKQEFVRFGPWDILIKVTNVLCSDGKYRTFWAQGQPDTFFTQPGRVKVNGKTVTGHIYYDSMYEDEETYPDGVYKFTAYSYRKNHRLLPPWDMAYTCTCGLYVHPDNPLYNVNAIHIDDCPYTNSVTN